MKTAYLILLSLALVSASQAAVLTVTNTADDMSAGCLRWCIERAQPGDEIQFDPSLDGQAIVLGGEELVVDKELTIAGSGPENTILDGNHASRVLRILAWDVTISSMTIRGGSSEFGGGIQTEGGWGITLDDCTVIGNSAKSSGGGIRIWGGGMISLTNSRIVGNTAGWTGGGVSADGAYYLTATDCTIADNTSSYGGGGGLYVAARQPDDPPTTLRRCSIVNNNGGGVRVPIQTRMVIEDSVISQNGGGGVTNSGWLYIARTTISGNTSGGADNSRFLTLANSTVSGNSGGGIHTRLSGEARTTLSSTTVTANDAWGVRKAHGIVYFENSVVADQVGADDCRNDDQRVPFVSEGHNLDSDDSCGFVQASDIAGEDPRLGPLQDNGGPTWTHAPLEGSPVIDRGWCDPGTDQRGTPRPLDGNRDHVWICDIGAVEYNPFAFRVVGPGGDAIVVPADGE